MNTDPDDERDAIEALLPWYAVGTLDAQSAKRVRDALRRRPDLEASLEKIREEKAETIALNDNSATPSGGAWARVLATAQAEPRRRTLIARLAAFLPFSGIWR